MEMVELQASTISRMTVLCGWMRRGVAELEGFWKDSKSGFHVLGIRCIS